MIKKFEDYNSKSELDFETFKEIFLDIRDGYNGRFSDYTKGYEDSHYFFYIITFDVDIYNNYYTTIDIEEAIRNNDDLIKRYDMVNDILMEFKSTISERLKYFGVEVKFKKIDEWFEIFVYKEK